MQLRFINISMDSLLRRAEAISKPGINESLFDIEKHVCIV
jgi:hypothetical protein